MLPFTFFISYRRRDMAPVALLLKHELEARMRFVRVAVDVEEMRPGENFPARLRGLIDGAHATIALIGPKWMPVQGEGGAGDGSTGDGPVDWVVEELQHSHTAPLGMAPNDRHGLDARALIPLFVDVERGYDRFALPASLRFMADLHSERIDSAEWPAAIGPLLDRLAMRLSRELRRTSDEFPRADRAKARTQPLPDDELAKILQYDDYEGWYVDNFGHADARWLVKTYKFASFAQACEFMTQVNQQCEMLDHHPIWRNVFKQVSVSLTTWDAHRRITIYDLNLALYMNMAAEVVRKK